MAQFVINIGTGNEAFDVNGTDEVKYVLEQAISMIAGERDCGRLYDSNGNRVGQVEYK